MSHLISVVQRVEILNRELLRLNAFCSGATNHFDRCVDSMYATPRVLEVQGIRSGAAAQIDDPVACEEERVDRRQTASRWRRPTAC